MELELYCRKCEKAYNGHWNSGVSVMNPKCPICKCDDVNVCTDETLDHEQDMTDMEDGE